MCKYIQNGHQTVFLHENIGLLERVIDTLRVERPNAWRAFELRIIHGIRRKDVQAMIGTNRPADVNELVDEARQYLISLLPPREDLL